MLEAPTASCLSLSSSTGKTHSAVGQTTNSSHVAQVRGHSAVGQTARALAAKYAGASVKNGKIRRNMPELQRNTPKYAGRSADHEYGEQEGVEAEAEEAEEEEEDAEEEEASFEIHSFSDEESRAEFVRRIRGILLFT